MKKAIAEFVGTFALVLIGCGTAVLAGMGTGAASVDILGIATAFGLTIVAMAYGIGQGHRLPHQSGGKLRRALSRPHDDAGFHHLCDRPGSRCHRGRSRPLSHPLWQSVGLEWRTRPEWLGACYLGEYSMSAAFIYEVVGTFLFLVCILGVTQRGAPVGLAGLAIGLTLVALHLLGINITGTSVNPARSFARAGHCRGGKQPAGACASVAVHRGAADWRGYRRLFVPVWHFCRRRRDPRPWRGEIRRAAGSLRATSAALEAR
jgi:aquaporin Z